MTDTRDAVVDVDISVVTPDASVMAPAGVAIDPTNGHSFQLDDSNTLLVLEIDATFAGAKNFTIKAGPGTGPNGWPQGGALGDLVVSLNAERALVPVPKMRFAQLDGTVWVDAETGATGTIRAYYFPLQ